jgi:hypothetical protein
MKIGLFVTGHARQPVVFEENFASILKDNLVDVYCVTWDVADNRKNHPSEMRMFVDGIVTDSMIMNFFGANYVNHKIIKTATWPQERKFTFKPIDRPNDIFHPNNIAKSRVQSFDNAWGMDIPQRILDQFNLVYECYKLCHPEVYFKYDVVIKIRFDNIFNHKLDLNAVGNNIHIDGSNLGYAEATNPNEPDLVPYTVSDRVAWGHPYAMEKYFHFGPNIWKMYEEDNVDISYSENLLARWLLKYPFFKGSPVGLVIHPELVFPLTDGR